MEPALFSYSIAIGTSISLFSLEATLHSTQEPGAARMDSNLPSYALSPRCVDAAGRSQVLKGLPLVWMAPGRS